MPAPPPEFNPSPEKTCTDCAETVNAAARKCRFCGFSFDTSVPVRTGSLNATSRAVRMLVILVLAVVGYFGVQAYVADTERAADSLDSLYQAP
jgi:hypothetical protein